MKRVRWFFIGMCMAFSAYATPILRIDVGIGKLIGAGGVDVGGVLYDVEFVRGTCAEVFPGCIVSSFTFTDLVGARTAAQALSDQVFIDSAFWSFDTQLGLTHGCPGSDLCVILMPYAVELIIRESGATVFDAVLTGVFGNSIYQCCDFVSGQVIPIAFSNYVWAVWTPQVPEPGTFPILALGLLALAFTRSTKP